MKFEKVGQENRSTVEIQIPLSTLTSSLLSSHQESRSTVEDFIFKKLIVWQKAMELTRLVYGIVKQFPADERFALSDQLRRAVISIPSNIAEGNGRASNRDYAHFLAIARGSLFETMTQLELAKDLGYIKDTPSIYSLAAEISRMLTSMLKKYGALEKSPLSP